MRNRKMGRAPFALIPLVLAFSMLNTGCGAGNSQVNNQVQKSIAAPGASVSPASLVFSTQVLNTSGSPQTVTLSNTGTASLAITAITVTGDFAQSNNCGTSLAVAASCTITVTFTPTQSGTQSGTLTITDNTGTSPHQVPLSGTFSSTPSPVAAVSPASIAFGNQVLNTTSVTQTVTLTNTGGAALAIAGIGTVGDFAQTNTCGTSVAAAASCTITVSFTPKALGARSGSLTINDNAAGSPQLVTLSGSGVSVPAPAVALSPVSVAFNSQILNTTSTAQTITLTNTGNASLQISGIATAGDFARSNTCGNSLAAGLNCTIAVTFTPTTTGTRSGTLTITDSASGSPHRVTLTGTGVTVPTPAVSLSTTAVAFGNQVLNTTSSTQAVTIINTGNASLTITGITASGDFGQTNNCGSTLGAGSSCTVTLGFTPSVLGAQTGTLSIADNAAGSPQHVTLTGSGVSAAIQHSVDLNWSATTPAPTTYNVYRSDLSGGPYTLIGSVAGTAIAYTDSTAVSGHIYYYVVTAIDSSNLESVPSNEAQAVIP